MKSLLKAFLLSLGLGVTSSQNLSRLREERAEVYQLRSIMKFISRVQGFGFSVNQLGKAISEIQNSKAQLQQDLVALMLTNFKQGGYFVEFGATDGLKFSNTFLLEKSYGWSGILAEPGANWHYSLKNNRTAKIETKCVWRTSREIVKFNETKLGELSTIDSFSFLDMHSDHRSEGTIYDVETISLIDLLRLYSAPEYIDYISIDTEGSEYEILSGFDFTQYRFGFISCEHNFNSNRQVIYELLSENGYIRILEETSEFDDWYIHSSLVDSEGLVKLT